MRYDTLPPLVGSTGRTYSYAIALRCPVCDRQFQGTSMQPDEVFRAQGWSMNPAGEFLMTCDDHSLADVHAKVHGRRVS